MPSPTSMVISPRSTRRRATPGGEQGFTISEAVLVMVLLATLIVVVVVSIRGLDHDGDRIECSDERRRLSVAAEQYRAEKGDYPTDVSTLEAANLLEVGSVTRLRITSSDDTAIQLAPVGSACG